MHSDSKNENQNTAQPQMNPQRPSVWALLRAFRDLLVTAVQRWSADNAARMAAAVAYYAVFSLAPLLLILIAIAGLVFGEQAARGEIVAQTESAIGPQAAESIQFLLGTVDEPSSGTIATIIGFGVLLVSASGLFAQLQGSLNTIWRRKAANEGGIGACIRQRLVAFLMVFLVGGAFIGLLILSTVLGSVQNLTDETFRSLGIASSLIDIPLTYAFLVVAMVFVLRFVPSVDIGWRDALVGAVFTAALLTIGKYIIQLYLQTSAVDSAYGLAGSIIVIMIWVYFSAQLFFMGAEFTRVYSERYGTLGRLDKREAASA
jgi:membrane protein